ncbi:hypothetical protein WB391_19460 [Lusitaniella coriacea LEGE 07167]
MVEDDFGGIPDPCRDLLDGNACFEAKGNKSVAGVVGRAVADDQLP